MLVLSNHLHLLSCYSSNIFILFNIVLISQFILHIYFVVR